MTSSSCLPPGAAAAGEELGRCAAFSWARGRCRPPPQKAVPSVHLRTWVITHPGIRYPAHSFPGLHLSAAEITAATPCSIAFISLWRFPWTRRWIAAATLFRRISNECFAASASVRSGSGSFERTRSAKIRHQGELEGVGEVVAFHRSGTSQVAGHCAARPALCRTYTRAQGS